MRTAKQRISLALLGLFLTLLALADVPALHRAIHPDANSPDHECSITLLARGHIDSCNTAIKVMAPAAVVIAMVTPPPVIFVSRENLLRPARGPPFVS
jgi:hypothetical protein